MNHLNKAERTRAGSKRRGQGSTWLRLAVPKLLSRRALWTALVALVLALLATLVWLARRYEANQVQAQLERDTTDAVSDLRNSLSRQVQILQALLTAPLTPANWAAEASRLLRDNREWLRMEWRDSSWQLKAFADSPLRAPAFERLSRAELLNEASQACQRGKQMNSPAYSSTYFLPQNSGLGIEVMELCMPLTQHGQGVGFVVVTYSLQELLTERLSGTFGRKNTLSFVEPDGTRLALAGTQWRERNVFSSQQLLGLPGNTLLLRMDGRQGEPHLFPNVLTALVAALSVALITVMLLLASDARRRLKAERDLADALAFRKAMEDSLVTGLRARDLQGCITYVNPAFCQMVGWQADALVGKNAPMPYWPPEMVDEYQLRQAIRMAGNAPPRDGFESVYIRKDGTRFPVLIIEAPLISVHGIQTGWMGAVIDISEQRHTEEISRTSQDRLQATARLATVGEMASLLSHELNQPLAAIASYANGSLNLLKNPQPEAQTLDNVHIALRRIAEQAERAGRVINSVHDFVRRRDRAREAVQAQSLLDAVAPLIKLHARKLQVRVHIRVAANLPAVWCDPTMVEQVLLNLARNGMQAMDSPQCSDRVLVLQVQLAEPEGGDARVAFSVADLGMGIAPEVQAQLCKPFFTTKPEGMGLGLSLCRTVLEQHGGQLKFEPNAPEGTVFHFALPTVDARSASHRL